MDEGCSHSRAAGEPQLEAFGYAVRLQLARILQQSEFDPMCEKCNNTSSPMCCLDCDYIGCPHHSDHEHNLACCLGTDYEGVLWCFKCRDVVVDKRFEHQRMREVERALEVPQSVRDSLHGTTKSDSDSMSTGAAMASLPAPEAGLEGTKLPSYHAHSGLRGLVNLGATCYVSVVLQSLVHNPLVRAFFLGGGHQRESCSRTSCLACSVDRLYSDFFASPNVMGYGITDMLISSAEKKPVMGAGSTEQDAHEFYLMSSNESHSAHISSPHLGNKSEDVTKCNCVAHRNFGGTVESKLSCTCGQVTRRWEPIVDLGLDSNPDPRAGVTTIKQASRRFTMSEMIANYTCENCGLQNTTAKQLKLSKSPPVSMIQLKRFKHLGGKGSIKADTPVDFGSQIDMGPYTSVVPHGGQPKANGANADQNGKENGATQNGHSRRTSVNAESETHAHGSSIYELYGVICHTGTSDTGHYTCMMKHSSGQWYHFDDVTVTHIDVNTVLKAKEAYSSFYVVKWAI